MSGPQEERNCIVCGKDISKEEVPERFKDYDGGSGWICNDCFCTQFEFYSGLSIKLPAWTYAMYNRLRGSHG